MLKEFKAFAMRGNVVDMAVGVIIGAAFGKIVTSFVNDVIMPPIGLLLGNMDFSSLAVHFTDDVSPTGPALRYGMFLNTVIDFVIVAFVIFLAIKQLNRFQPKPPPAPVTTKECPHCLSQIPMKARKCAHCTSEV